jgi:hypothetical protein
MKKMLSLLAGLAGLAMVAYAADTGAAAPANATASHEATAVTSPTNAGKTAAACPLMTPQTATCPMMVHPGCPMK